MFEEFEEFEEFEMFEEFQKFQMVSGSLRGGTTKQQGFKVSVFQSFRFLVSGSLRGGTACPDFSGTKQ
jgi:hypothetical protein